jgi:hypothetical protein
MKLPDNLAEAIDIVVSAVADKTYEKAREVGHSKETADTKAIAVCDNLREILERKVMVGVRRY